MCPDFHSVYSAAPKGFMIPSMIANVIAIIGTLIFTALFLKKFKKI